VILNLALNGEIKIIIRKKRREYIKGYINTEVGKSRHRH